MKSWLTTVHGPVATLLSITQSGVNPFNPQLAFIYIMGPVWHGGVSQWCRLRRAMKAVCVQEEWWDREAVLSTTHGRLGSHQPRSDSVPPTPKLILRISPNFHPFNLWGHQECVATQMWSVCVGWEKWDMRPFHQQQPFLKQHIKSHILFRKH